MTRYNVELEVSDDQRLVTWKLLKDKECLSKGVKSGENALQQVLEAIWTDTEVEQFLMLEKRKKESGQ